MMIRSNLIVALIASAPLTGAFEAQTSNKRAFPTSSALHSATLGTADNDLAVQKKKLLGLLKPEPVADPILADPITKEPLVVTSTSGTILGGQLGPNKVKYTLKASPSTAEVYAGDSLSYINLLESVDTLEKASGEESSAEDTRNELVKRLTPLVPPPLRIVLSSSGLVGDDYIPMRDLFTSPAVSYAYERGWRQGFAQAGFPGPEEEATLAMEYFAPAMMGETNRVLVDMSCATGLFTRRFAKSGKYTRVLGCDYSDSMLKEARRRIQADPQLSGRRRRRMQPYSDTAKTQLDLIRLDVGQIPMQTDSVNAINAGAAMHCWPDLPAAMKEIHRVLKPGGRYFATTFLSSYFGMLRNSNFPSVADNNEPNSQVFQYFESVEVLRKLVEEEGGFAPEKVFIEVLGNACVVIRAEK